MYIVILAGGSGTRFWPLSRTVRPKQLISITGDRTMLQRTVERVLPLKPERILIVTNAVQAEETKRQLSSYNAIPIDVVAEPRARNTAPAIGLAATIISARDPNAIMAVLPADHFIKDEAAFRGAIMEADRAARNGSLVTLGIMPSRPETGYGYIEAEVSPEGFAPFLVRRFVEKPPLEKAVKYLEQGNYFWNSGVFIWSCAAIIEEIRRHMPNLAALLAPLSLRCDEWECFESNAGIETLYDKTESTSIDYGVMERSDKVRVIPVEMGWSDVGSWSALPEIVKPDISGMVSINADNQINIDSSDCLVYGDRRVIAMVGVKDLIVVSTPDALLVCHRDQAQDVKKVVEELARSGKSDVL